MSRLRRTLLQARRKFQDRKQEEGATRSCRQRWRARCRTCSKGGGDWPSVSTRVRLLVLLQSPGPDLTCTWISGAQWTRSNR